MTQDLYDYTTLIEKFLSKEISVKEFANAYVDKHLNDENKIDDDLFEQLDFLFAEANGYTDDGELIKQQPEFHFTEEQLRITAAHVLKEINRLYQYKVK